MNELFVALQNKETREFIAFIIETYETIEELQSDLEDVREVGQKLNKEVNRLQAENFELKKDRTALMQFIEDTVKDEEQLGKIFN
jgi:regulator of replication initiation timing